MQATALYSSAEHALTLDQIDHALNQIKDRKAVLIESRGARRNWDAGYAVKVNDAFYWFPRGTAIYFRLPSFVRSEEDALEFILAAEEWYLNAVTFSVKQWRNRLIEIAEDVEAALKDVNALLEKSEL